MSFWFSQNTILSTKCRHNAFLTNNVLERILLICQTLQVSHGIQDNNQKLILSLSCLFVLSQEEKYIVCKQCRQKIGKFDSLFPMSKEGVRTNFCNRGKWLNLITKNNHH